MGSIVPMLLLVGACTHRCGDWEIQSGVVAANLLDVEIYESCGALARPGGHLFPVEDRLIIQFAPTDDSSDEYDDLDAMSPSPRVHMRLSEVEVGRTLDYGSDQLRGDYIFFDAENLETYVAPLVSGRLTFLDGPEPRDPEDERFTYEVQWDLMWENADGSAAGSGAGRVRFQEPFRSSYVAPRTGAIPD